MDIVNHFTCTADDGGNIKRWNIVGASSNYNNIIVFSRDFRKSRGNVFFYLAIWKTFATHIKSLSLTTLPRPRTNDEPTMDTLTRRPFRRRLSINVHQRSRYAATACAAQAMQVAQTWEQWCPTVLRPHGSRQGLCLSDTSSCRAANQLLQGIEGTSCVVPALLFVVIEDALLDCMLMLTKGLHISVFNLHAYLPTS